MASARPEVLFQTATCLEINNILQKNQTEGIYQSCVLSTFLYGYECWRITERDLRYMSTFHTKCFRNIMRILWPQILSNKQLFRTTGQDIMNNILARRRCRSVGHVLRNKDDSISKTALRWTDTYWKKKTWTTQQMWRMPVKINWNNYI